MRTDTQQPDTVSRHALAPAQAPCLPAAKKPSVTPHEEQVFQLQIQLDLQRERALLFKVILVLQTVVALLMLREWALQLLL